MTRTYVVTGSASGIGRATAERIARDGHRVIDVDLHDATITVDLATADGREALVSEVRDALAGDPLDAVVANAGTMASPELCVRVNHFGAIATLEGLRPLMAGSHAPRAVATASCSVIGPHDPALVEACLAGDEEAAVAASEGVDLLGYPSSKRALARWVRAAAIRPEWAGAGIALNAVAPGIVETPMVQQHVGDPAMRELFDAAVPMPFGGHCQPEHVAELIAFLAAPDTERLTGQVVFVDGGSDAVQRGDDVF